MTYSLFEQGTAQLNFLLNAQRQIIIVSALSVALATYSENFKYKYVKYIPLLLFGYVLGFGIKACIDFDAFIEEAKIDSPNIDENEKDLLNRWYGWLYFTYFLIFIILLLAILFVRIDIFPTKVKK